MKLSEEGRAELFRKVADLKGKAPERIVAAAEEEIKIKQAAIPGRKGKVMTALYLLGCSYTQIAELFQVKKATVAQAVHNHTQRKTRENLRPPTLHQPIADIQTASIYFRASLQSIESEPFRLAAEIRKIALPIIEDENEDVLNLRDEAGDQTSRIGEGSDGRAGANTEEPGAEPSSS